MADLVEFNGISFPREISFCPHNSAAWSDLSLDHVHDITVIRYDCGTTRTENPSGEVTIAQSHECEASELRILRDLNPTGLQAELKEANTQVSLLKSEELALQGTIRELEARVAALEGGKDQATGFTLEFGQPVSKGA